MRLIGHAQTFLLDIKTTIAKHIRLQTATLGRKCRTNIYYIDRDQTGSPEIPDRGETSEHLGSGGDPETAQVLMEIVLPATGNHTLTCQCSIDCNTLGDGTRRLAMLAVR